MADMKQGLHVIFGPMEEKRDDMIAGIPKRGLRNIRILRKIEKTEMRGRDSI